MKNKYNPQYGKDTVKAVILNEGLLYAIKDYMDEVAISDDDPELKRLWAIARKQLEKFEELMDSSGRTPGLLIRNIDAYAIIVDPPDKELSISELSEDEQAAVAAIDKTLSAILEYVGLDKSEFGENFETGGKLSEAAKQVIKPEWERMQLQLQMFDKEIPRGMQSLINDMIDKKIARKTVTKNDDNKREFFLKEAQPAIDAGYITVKPAEQKNSFHIRLAPTTRQLIQFEQGGEISAFAAGGDITMVDTVKFPLQEQQRLIGYFINDRSKKASVVKELQEYRDSYKDIAAKNPEHTLFGKPYAYYADEYQKVIDYVNDFNGDVMSIMIESEQYPSYYTVGEFYENKPLYSKEEIELFKRGYRLETAYNTK